MPTMTTEDYVIALNTLRDEGVRAIPARVAERTGVSAPTVTLALRRLERDGYIVWTGRREIELTRQGLELAESLMRRHRLVERWLTDVLGLDWAAAHEEAHRLEHAISPIVEQRLLELMNFPTTCPHGNPIPGIAGERPPSVRLAGLPVGTRARLFRISEIAESERELMLWYFDQGFRPEIELEVLAGTPEAVEVLVAGHQVRLSRRAAEFLWMHEPEPTPV